MGLDITAHSKIKLEALRSIEDYSRLDGDGIVDGREHFYAWPAHIDDNNPFPDQVCNSGLRATGIYTWESAYLFRAGAYWYYNRWRDELSRVAVGVPSEVVWNNKDQYRSKPFFLIINFTDCDGIIAGPAIKTLAADFAEHHARIAVRTSAEFMELYARFEKAFALALDSGCVRFH